MRFITAMTVIIFSSANAHGNELIPFSPWAGAEVTVKGKKNIDTERAVIHVKHLPRNAQKFCEEHNADKSAECIKKRLQNVSVAESIQANCKTGEFVNLDGEQMRFKGLNRKSRYRLPKYAIIGKGVPLDGSTASRYDIMLSQFSLLCPSRVGLRK